MKNFPVDIFGVKEFGVEQWRSGFFWPVLDHEFFSITDQIGDVYLQEIQKSSQTVRDILLSNIGLIQQCGMFMHALLVIDRLKKTGHELMLNEGSQYYFEILSRKYRHRPNQAGVDFAQGAKNRIKQAAKYLLKNCFSGSAVLKTLKDHKHIVSLGTFTRLKEEYCRRNKILVTHRSHIDFLKSGSSWRLKNSKARELEAVVENINGHIRKLAEYWGLPLDDFLEDYLSNLNRGPLYSCYSLYKGIFHDYKKRIDLVLLSEVAKPLNKTICFALKRKYDTMIVGFEHGNTFGSLLSRYFSASELAHCDEYVVSTTGSVPNFREAQKIARFPYGTGTRISSVNTDYYRNLVEKHRDLDLPNRIRRVMLVGFPMNQNRYMDFPGHFSLFHLDLELRLLDFLRQKGFIAIYKVHPDRRREAGGIFEETSDEIMAEPFEKVYGKCDAYLFAHTDSSTFGFAVCTNKPIVVIDIKGRPWKGNAYELLSKRCRMVSARIDESCRILFDEFELEKALNRDIEDPDMEYVEKLGFASRKEMV